MFHSIRLIEDDEGYIEGYVASAHEHEETPACWSSEVVPTAGDAIEASGVPREHWRKPDADADPDVILIADA